VRSSTRCTASSTSTSATCSGFVDGTENPGRVGRRSLPPSVGDEDPDFAGGLRHRARSTSTTSTAWNALPVEEQERVIGRTKLDDIEMPDDVKPANSHVALNTITDADGEQRQIVRDNMPFGRSATASSAPTSSATPRPRRDRADAEEHVHRRPTGQLRPDPRLLDRRDRKPFFVPTADFLEDNAELNELHAEAFETRLFSDEEWDWSGLLDRHSLGWVVARSGDRLAGFVNVVSDGLVHAWLQDTMVALSDRGRAIGTGLVKAAAEAAREAGYEWLHVDFDDDLRAFYFDACGFRPTNAGLMQLQSGD
jgi:GNAT superfamily N-acetyltransferase